MKNSDSRSPIHSWSADCDESSVTERNLLVVALSFQVIIGYGESKGRDRKRTIPCHRDEPKETNRRLSTSIDVKWSLSLRYQIPIVVRSSFSDVESQVIRKRTNSSEPSLVEVIRNRTNFHSEYSIGSSGKERSVLNQTSVESSVA